MATMAALIASDSSGQAAQTSVKSASSCAEGAKLGAKEEPQVLQMLVFSVFVAELHRFPKPEVAGSSPAGRCVASGVIGGATTIALFDDDQIEEVGRELLVDVLVLFRSRDRLVEGHLAPCGLRRFLITPELRAYVGTEMQPTALVRVLM